MADVIRGIGLFVFGSLAVWFALFAWQISTGDKQQYESNRRRMKMGQPVSDFDLRRALHRPWRPWP